RRFRDLEQLDSPTGVVQCPIAGSVAYFGGSKYTNRYEGTSGVGAHRSLFRNWGPIARPALSFGEPAGIRTQDRAHWAPSQTIYGPVACALSVPFTAARQFRILTGFPVVPIHVAYWNYD